jgi:hypothetical protein
VVGVYSNTILEKRGAIAIMAQAAGLSWPVLMGTIVELAGTRCGVDWGNTPQAIPSTAIPDKPLATAT